MGDILNLSLYSSNTIQVFELVFIELWIWWSSASFESESISKNVHMHFQHDIERVIN